MKKISIIEAKNALKNLFHEIETTEGAESYLLLCDFIEQAEQEKISNK
jgi:hypothetical protein